jgi:spore germination cell wall hydrolase CwlJ-like protein
MKTRFSNVALIATACVCLSLSALTFKSESVYATPPYFDGSIQSDYDCMVEAIYYEAGNQPFIGKIAVGQVVMNRVNSRYYPDDVCSVVHEGPISEWWWENHGRIVPIRNKCQFSYYCDGKEEVVYEGKNWEDSQVATLMVLNNVFLKDLTGGATHYHADYVSPWWAKKLTRTVTIENHLFFKR